MLNIIANALEDLGIQVEKTIAIGRYVVLKVILSSGRKAIAKIPRPCIEDTGSRECEEKSKDLDLEAEYLLRIRSRNVVELIELLDIGLAKILVREYVDSTLRDIITKKRPSYTEVIEITKEIALALEDVHRAGFVYTDLKPENIGIDNNGRTLLLDLDSLTPPFTKPKFITYSYAPPEYLKNGIVVYESDVYQLALVALEMMLGRYVDNLTAIESIESKELRDLLKSMLNSVPFTRPSTSDIARKLSAMLKLS